jgi:hypothetical protein
MKKVLTDPLVLVPLYVVVAWQLSSEDKFNIDYLIIVILYYVIAIYRKIDKGAK